MPPMGEGTVEAAAAYATHVDLVGQGMVQNFLLGMCIATEAFLWTVLLVAPLGLIGDLAGISSHPTCVGVLTFLLKVTFSLGQQPLTGLGAEASQGLLREYGSTRHSTVRNPHSSEM